MKVRLFFRQEHPRDGGGLRGISHFQNKKVFAYLISMIILHVCNTERTQRFWFNCNPKIVFKPYNNFIFKFDNLKKNTRVSDKNQEFHYYFFWGGNYLWQNYNVLKNYLPQKERQHPAAGHFQMKFIISLEDSVYDRWAKTSSCASQDVFSIPTVLAARDGM